MKYSFILNDTGNGKKLATQKVKCIKIQTLSTEKENLVDSFMQKSTLHGVSELDANGKIKLKVFWWIALVTALGASIYGCFAIVSSYLESPIVVSYMVHEKRDFQLPDIVLCPFNRLNASYLREHKISADLAAFIELAFGFVGMPYKFQVGQTLPNMSTPENLKLIAELDHTLLRMNASFSELVQNGSLTCTELIKYCVSTNGSYDCCATAIPTMTSVGKCFRLSGTEQRAAGYGFGLTIVLHLPQAMYTPAVNNLHNDGIAVKLVEKGKGLDYDLKFVPNGVHTLMPLRATLFKFMNNPPHFRCIDTTLVANYSRLSCFDKCIFDIGNQICHCRHIASLNNQYPPCSTSGFYGCLITETQKVFNANQHIDSECHEKCLPLCEYWQYSTSISFAKFPSTTIRQFLESDHEYEEMKNSIILDIFFEKLEYTLIEHHRSMTVATFIANIGGQLGLWVGASILTLVQVIVFLVQLLLICIQMMRRKLISGASSDKSSPSTPLHGFGNSPSMAWINHSAAGERLSAYNKAQLLLTSADDCFSPSSPTTIVFPVRRSRSSQSVSICSPTECSDLYVAARIGHQNMFAAL